MSNIRGSALGSDNIYSPAGNARSPGVNGELWDDGENYDNARQQQFSGALLGELATQKSKFNKKFHILEKQVDQLRAEKGQLAQVLETQR